MGFYDLSVVKTVTYLVFDALFQSVHVSVIHNYILHKVKQASILSNVFFSKIILIFKLTSHLNIFPIS